MDSPPTEAGFGPVSRAVAGLPYVDLEKLEKAYWQVPVVSQEDIGNAKLMLETFADYLVTDWQRLSEVIREQRRQVRESQLCRQEFAHLLLDGGERDPVALRESMNKIGFTRYPNRVLLVRPETEEEYEGHALSFDLSLTASLHAIEEFCEKQDNVAVAYLRKRGICVFFNDREGRNPSAGEFYAHRLARSILHAVADHGDMRVRVGIGTAKADWRSLPESYHEAFVALASSAEVMAAYQKPAPSFEELSAAADRVCRSPEQPQSSGTANRSPESAIHCLTRPINFFRSVRKRVSCARFISS